MEEKRITGKSKTEELFYSDILKLAEKKNITVEAARKELLKKMEKEKKKN